MRQTLHVEMLACEMGDIEWLWQMVRACSGGDTDWMKCGCNDRDLRRHSDDFMWQASDRWWANRSLHWATQREIQSKSGSLLIDELGHPLKHEATFDPHPRQRSVEPCSFPSTSTCRSLSCFRDSTIHMADTPTHMATMFQVSITMLDISNTDQIS